MTANSVTFPTLTIWVQVWDLPINLINEEAGWEIGKGLGHVYEVDNKTFLSDQARFIRIRVGIPLEKPIHRGGWVTNPEGFTRCELASSTNGWWDYATNVVSSAMR